jgi:hypothetical protein
MTFPNGRASGLFLSVIVALASAALACSHPHACAGEARCVPEERLSPRARCEHPSAGVECACGAADWGSPCSKHVDCKCRLECVDAVCVATPRCDHKD